MAEPTIATIMQAIFTLTFLSGFLPLLTSLWHFCQLLERRAPSYRALHHRLHQTKLPARMNKNTVKKKEDHENWKKKKKKHKPTPTHQLVMSAFRVDWCVERALHGTYLRLRQTFPTLFTMSHQVREDEQQISGNEGGSNAIHTAPSRQQLKQIEIVCGKHVSSLYFINRPLTFISAHVQNGISKPVASYDAKDERTEISYPMATTWSKSVNFSLWPYVLHYAMQFYYAATVVLQENFLRFQVGAIMQEKDTNICSSSITRTYKIGQGNTSMPYFKNTGLILNFNPILCYVDRYLKLCYTKYLILPYYNWQFMKVRHSKSDIMTRATKIHQEQTGPVKNDHTRDSWNISLQVQTDPMQYSEGDSPQTGTAIFPNKLSCSALPNDITHMSQCLSQAP